MRWFARYSTLYIVLALVLFFVSMFVEDSDSVPVVATLQSPADSTLELLLELGKLVAAVNTAMLAAAVSMVVKGKDWTTTWGRLDSYLVVLAILSGAMSYYGIYVGHDALLGMVFQGVVHPFEAKLETGLNIQYYGMLVGVFLVGLVFTRILEGRDSEKPGHNA